jgi:hypothetical protein
MKLYMFVTVPLSIIRSFFTVHTAMVYVIQVFLRAFEQDQDGTGLVLLLQQHSFPNKFEKLVNLFGFIIRISCLLFFEMGKYHSLKTLKIIWTGSCSCNARDLFLGFPASNLALSFLMVFLSTLRQIPVTLQQPLSNCSQFVTQQSFYIRHCTVGETGRSAN